MKLSVLDLTGAVKGEVDLSDELLILNGKGTQAVHDTVVAYLANQRLGTAKTKQISEVKVTGRKPWRQKGTGRARAGSYASPIWRGGGVVFGPHPRDYSMQVPKKVRSLAFRKAISERMQAGDFVVASEITLQSPKTKEVLLTIQKLGISARRVLIVVEEVDANLKLASRNLENVECVPVSQLNVYEILLFDKLIITEAALEKLQARMGKS